MNPSTGTFITMDEYAGSVFEPVSLHKYLYANANPVMYSDPTGYSTYSDTQVSVAGMAILCATITAACTCGFQILTSLNTTISTSSIFNDGDILGWSQGIAGGAITSADLAKKIKDKSKDDPEDIAIDIALPDDPPNPDRPYYTASVGKGGYVDVHLNLGYGYTLDEAKLILTTNPHADFYTKYEFNAEKLCNSLGGIERSYLDENKKSQKTPHLHAYGAQGKHVFFGGSEWYRFHIY